MKSRRLILDLDADAKQARKRESKPPVKAPLPPSFEYLAGQGRPATDQEMLQVLAQYGITGPEAMRQLSEMKSCNGGSVYRPVETVPVLNPTHNSKSAATNNPTIIDKVQGQYVNPPPVAPFQRPKPTVKWNSLLELEALTSPDAVAFVEDLEVNHGFTHADAIKRLKEVASSGIYCEHANESPHTCPCPAYCICRTKGNCRSDKHGKH